MRTHFLALAALLALAGSAPVSLAQTKIAVANPGKILNDLAETKDINKAAQAELAALKQQVDGRDVKLKELQEKRDALKTDSPQWSELHKQLVAQKTERDTFAKATQDEIFRKLRDNAKRMHEKIGVTVSEIAKAKGFDLVIAEQKPEANEEQLQQMNHQQITQFLMARNVLFKSDAIDITNDVIAKLDSAYQAK